MKPLVIGLAPGRLPSGGHHVTPLTYGTGGRRLASLCGLSEPHQLADHFELVNLYSAPIPRGHVMDWPDAHKRAGGLHLKFTSDRRIVMLGFDVQRAFGEWASQLGNFEWQCRSPSNYQGSYFVARCPHPSGRSRFWNDGENVWRGQLFWRRLLRDADEG